MSQLTLTRKSLRDLTWDDVEAIDDATEDEVFVVTPFDSYAVFVCYDSDDRLSLSLKGQKASLTLDTTDSEGVELYEEDFVLYW